MGLVGSGRARRGKVGCEPYPIVRSDETVLVGGRGRYHVFNDHTKRINGWLSRVSVRRRVIGGCTQFRLSAV